MSNFTLNFTHPWLLLLLIPAVALLIFAMLRVPRKYRNSRQRVVSVVLEAIVFLCAILALAGFSFSYVLGNPENEVILLVDVTDSMEDSAGNRDNYIRELLEIGAEDGCTMGIVTFGYTQVYAAPLDTKVDKVYDEYKSARLPDTTATDLASAIEYTAKLFNNPLNSKIVVISDGKETDESALSAISYVTSRGILVESVYIPSQYESDDVQILSVDMPEGKVTKGEAFDMTVNLQSNYDTNVTIIVTDNGETLTDIGYVDYENSDGSFDISEGRTSITLRCILDTKELHSIRIKVGGDAEEYISENNEYYLYFYIDNYNKILIFESQEGQGSDLSDVLKEYGTADSDGEDAYDITIKTLKRENSTDLPLTVNELRQYDLVILDNVSNSDMFYSYLSYLDGLSLLDADGDYYQYFYSTSTGDLKGSNDGGLLPRLLNDYVYYYGGGLLTSGGTDEDGNANMYSRSDTYGSVLENMLPVRTINYVPPTGVMFIIDTSGSVAGSVSNAIDGVSNSLSLLGVGGYVGIMDFSAKGNVILPMTSLTEAAKIDAALNDLKNNIQGGGTSLSSALNTAIATLTASSGLYERMHIVLVTDGNISDYSACTTYANTCHSRGITMSCMIFGEYGTRYLEQMAKLCEIANGDGTVVYDEESYTNCKHIYNCSGTNSIADCIYNDIQSLVEEEINYQEMMISIDSSYRFSTLVDGLQYYEVTTDDYGDEVVEYDTTHLYAYIERYYGTTVKSDASLILTGDYSVPLYAQWSYGEGMVGSYMGDLYHGENDSGGETMTILNAVDGETSGITFIIRVVNGLLAAEDIRPTGIDATLTEDNYTNRITVYADVEDGWYVEGTIYDENGGEVLSLNEVTPESEVTEETEFYVTTALTEGNGYARVDFVIKVPGIYTIVLSVKDSDGNVVRNDDGTYMTTTLYKVTVYSAEYENYDAADGLELMDSISTGTGYALTTMGELGLVFEGFVTEIIKDVNPTMALIIIALVLFLLAVAVRKFKWKWPHELVRERNERKQRQQAGGSR